MKSIKKLHEFLLVLLCISSISTGITLIFTQFLPNNAKQHLNEEKIVKDISINFKIDVDCEISKEIALFASAPIEDEPNIITSKEVDSLVSKPLENTIPISNPDPNLIESPPKESEALIPTSNEDDQFSSKTIDSSIVTLSIINVEILITIDLGVKIGLGNEKNMTCPSPDWNFNIIGYAIVAYDTVSEQVLDDLYIIVQDLVVEWIQTVEEKGVRKQLERRGIILNYDVEILELPM